MTHPILFNGAVLDVAWFPWAPRVGTFNGTVNPAGGIPPSSAHKSGTQPTAKKVQSKQT